VVGGKAADYIADERGRSRKKKHEEYDDDGVNDEDGVMGDRSSHKKEIASYGAMDDEDKEVQHQSKEKEVEYASSDDKDVPEEGTDETPYLNAGMGNSLKIDRVKNALIFKPLCVDPAARLLLIVELFERTAVTTIVKARTGIDKAYLNTEPDRGRCLQTMGCNLEEL